MDLDLELLQDLPAEEVQAGGCGISCTVTGMTSCPASCGASVD